MSSISRRLFLRNTAVVGAVAAGATLPAISGANDSMTPDQRIEAAMGEISKALQEKHSDFKIKTRFDTIRPVVGPVQRVAVTVFASPQLWGPEELAWFVKDGSPLLADDITGTNAFADWEMRS